MNLLKREQLCSVLEQWALFTNLTPPNTRSTLIQKPLKQLSITGKASVITQWVREIRSFYAATPMVVGLDVEWKPHMEPSLNSRLATLQTYIDCKCLIIHLFYIDYCLSRLPQELLD